MQVYLIESEDPVVIRTKILEIVQKKKMEDIPITYYNMVEKSIDDVVYELDTYSFLEKAKIIVCENAIFLTSTKTKSDVEHHLPILKKYLSHPSEENLLILCCDKVSDRKEIQELLAQNVEVVSSQIDIFALVQKALQDYQMTSDTISYLISYCNKENEKILTSLETLKDYKFEEKRITKEDIDQVILKTYQEDVFTLVNAIAKRNREKAFEIYSRLMEKDHDASKLVYSIANQFRTLYTTKILTKEGLGEMDIAKLLKVKPNAISIAKENSRGYTEEELLTFLGLLSDLDISIKTGMVSGNTLFELFLLKL